MIRLLRGACDKDCPWFAGARYVPRDAVANVAGGGQGSTRKKRLRLVVIRRCLLPQKILRFLFKVGIKRVPTLSQHILCRNRQGACLTA